MVGHTPGEWRLNPDGDESCSDPSIEGPDGPIATIHHTTRVVGEGADARVEWGHVEDGHLIAAAPDLLAACDGLLDVLDWLGANLPEETIIPLMAGVLIEDKKIAAIKAVKKANGGA